MGFAASITHDPNFGSEFNSSKHARETSIVFGLLSHPHHQAETEEARFGESCQPSGLYHGSCLLRGNEHSSVRSEAQRGAFDG